ncbi:MAG: hypothetical protein M3N54_08815 [Acidobacteriota bacterium]|nr:hypothetical protein [Acidobacteriota bacterium]
MPPALKRLILWDYPRGVWQYDVVCAVILVFIAFTPREWFRDQPRIPHASQITSLPGHGEGVFWIDPELVSSIPEAQRLASLSKTLSVREGKPRQLLRIEPIFDDSEKELKGYLGFTRP